jgi:hypothetical protein
MNLKFVQNSVIENQNLVKTKLPKPTTDRLSGMLPSLDNFMI